MIVLAFAGGPCGGSVGLKVRVSDTRIGFAGGVAISTVRSGWTCCNELLVVLPLPLPLISFNLVVPWCIGGGGGGGGVDTCIAASASEREGGGGGGGGVVASMVVASATGGVG